MNSFADLQSGEGKISEDEGTVSSSKKKKKKRNTTSVQILSYPKRGEANQQTVYRKYEPEEMKNVSPKLR